MQVHGTGLVTLTKTALCQTKYLLSAIFPEYNWFLKIFFPKTVSQNEAKYWKKNTVYSYTPSTPVLLNSWHKDVSLCM